MEPFPPVVNPGDLVEIVGVEFPRGSGRIKPWMGLFQDVGDPASTADVPREDIGKLLDEKLVGTVKNGDWCLVVATRFCEGDKKWYYLLRDPGSKKSFGWSRASIRFHKIQP